MCDKKDKSITCEGSSSNYTAALRTVVEFHYKNMLFWLMLCAAL